MQQSGSLKKNPTTILNGCLYGSTVERPNTQNRFISLLLTPVPVFVSKRKEKKREAKVRFNRVKFSPSPCCIALCSQLTELA